MRKSIRAAFILAAFSITAPVFAGSKQWTTGNSNFAAYVKIDYDIQFKKETKQSYANLSPEMGAKLFGVNAPVLNADLIVGNYGSYSQDKWYSIPSVDVNQAKNWSVYSGVQIFGITIWQTTKNIGAVEQDLVGVNKWMQKSLPAIRYPLGPVTVDVNFGTTQSIGAKPKVKPNGLTSLSAEFQPSVSAGAFVEGAVNAHVLRGGVGANLTVLNGSAGPKATISLETKSVNILASLYTQLLNGRVFGFVDRISISCCFKSSWKRIVDITILKWDGLKYSAEYPLWAFTF